jgi:hypothetical protein
MSNSLVLHKCRDCGKERYAERLQMQIPCKEELCQE